MEGAQPLLQLRELLRGSAPLHQPYVRLEKFLTMQLPKGGEREREKRYTTITRRMPWSYVGFLLVLLSHIQQ